MLRTTRLRKGADELKLEMRKACPFPLCDLLPSKGTSHAPFSIYSVSLAECAEGHMTPISRVNCWGQDGHHLCWANLFPRDLLLRYLSVSMGCLSCHKIRSLGSNGWTTCKCSKERLFEERVRKQESETGKNSSLRKSLRKRRCFGYWWPYVVLSLPGKDVLSFVLVRNISPHYSVTQALT